MSIVSAPHTPLHQLGAVALRRQLGDDPEWKRYEEQVINVHGAGRYTILLRPTLSGLAASGPLGPACVKVPSVPLYQLGALHLRSHLGQSGPSAVATGGSIAAALLPKLFPAAAGAGPLAPIAIAAMGVALLASVIAGLWAKHDARVKGAKAENQAINSAVSTFDQTLKAVFAAANSSDATQNITAAQAISALPGLLQTFFQKMAPFTSAPGAADASHGGANCGTVNMAAPCTGMVGGHACNKDCTATCCVGCQDLAPTIAAALQVFQNGGGTITACTVYGSKYGANQRNGYTLTYTPPTITASATASGVESSISSVATAAGLPSWAPMAAGAVLLLLLLKK